MKVKTASYTKGAFISQSFDFSTENLQARREWHNILKVIKGNKVESRIFYLRKFSFRTEREIKSFLDK